MTTEEPSSHFRPIDRSQHLLLVVDDEPASLYSTVRQLQSAGFRTCEAVSGMAGLAMATDAISAMVVDVHLPDMDGFELCRRLRKNPATARMPVLHLTAAYVTDADKVRGLDSGADAYLTRPVEPAVLVATVQALVRARVAEEAMRHSEAKFRAIYAQAPGGIGLLDGEGRFVGANPALQQLMGRPESDLAGQLLDAFVPEGAVPAARELMRRTGGHPPAEIPVLRPDGVQNHLEWSVSHDVEPGLHMVLVNDISERLLLEQQRGELLERERVARAEAERVNRTKDDFIAVLSHELRTPLNAIVQWTHVLMKSGGTPEQQRGLAAIDRNVKIQGRMITDLLDMSRLDTGKLPLQRELLDPLELVQTAVQAMQQSLEDNGNTLVLEANAAGGGAFRAILADGARLQQTLWNLITNAVKFSPRGARIWIRLDEDDEGLSITVRDEGQGMTAEFMPHAFERFTQSHTLNNRGRGGLGLGLSIVKQLVEAHGGTVTVASAGLGQGTTFTLRLPAEATAVGSAPPDSGLGGGDSVFGSLDDEPSLDPMLPQVRLLIVEDDREAGAMLQLILRDRGAEVGLAHDVQSALALIRQGQLDLVVSDIGMPDQDGYDLIREVRRLEAASPGAPRLPAIALTAFARAQDQEQALAAGFDLHCAKPVRHAQLVQMIRALLLRQGALRRHEGSAK